jgi:hypothetical protein
MRLPVYTGRPAPNQRYRQGSLKHPTQISVVDALLLSHLSLSLPPPPPPSLPLSLSLSLPLSLSLFFLHRTLSPLAVSQSLFAGFSSQGRYRPSLQLSTTEPPHPARPFCAHTHHPSLPIPEIGLGAGFCGTLGAKSARRYKGPPLLPPVPPLVPPPSPAVLLLGAHGIRAARALHAPQAQPPAATSPSPPPGLSSSSSSSSPSSSRVGGPEESSEGREESSEL